MPRNVGLYLLGFLLVVVGLALAAHLAGVPTPWIVAGAIVLAGFAVLRASRRTPPSGPAPPAFPPK
jgi:hypothetical protein